MQYMNIKCAECLCEPSECIIIDRKEPMQTLYKRHMLLCEYSCRNKIDYHGSICDDLYKQAEPLFYIRPSFQCIVFYTQNLETSKGIHRLSEATSF